jgi:hypothetical protein
MSRFLTQSSFALAKNLIVKRNIVYAFKKGSNAVNIALVKNVKT